ncbi:MAG: CBS domain-containing protein [Candidatus Eremiobacterota bacterium]
MTTQVLTLGDIAQKRETITISPEATVRAAARKMAGANKGAVLIVSQGRLCGIFTERDLLNRVVAAGLDPETTPVSSVMTDRLLVARADDPYQAGLAKMMVRNCRHLPLVQGDRVVGMVSRRDLMATEIRELEKALDLVDPASLFI